VTSTKQFVWSGGAKPREARNSAGAVTGQYFPLGEVLSGTSYLYTRDYLGSIREMTNSGGSIVGQLDFDPYGRATTLQGSTAPDFQFAGYYAHAASGLALTASRALNSFVGRFINRDPIEENSGNNLYAYVGNSPEMSTDSLGYCSDDHAPYIIPLGPSTPIPPNPNLPVQFPNIPWGTGLPWGNTPGGPWYPNPWIPLDPYENPNMLPPWGNGGKNTPPWGNGPTWGNGIGWGIGTWELGPEWGNKAWTNPSPWGNGDPNHLPWGLVPITTIIPPPNDPIPLPLGLKPYKPITRKRNPIGGNIVN
jgi:RHS repeat-associated protein